MGKIRRPAFASTRAWFGYSHQRTRIVTVVALIIMTTVLSMGYFATHSDFVSVRRSRFGKTTDAKLPELRSEPELEARSMEAAGNATLGFSSIRFINMKHRFDRLDAARLQAYVSGLMFEEYPAVEPDQILSTGMPPTSSPSRLQASEKGCYRAHANIWSEVVQKRLPPVLILESDASWDINIRPIMSILNQNFVKLLYQMQSTPRHTSFYKPDANLEHDKTSTVQFDPNDPWLSEHWDLLSIGHCNEHPGESHTDIMRIYKDPYVVSGYKYSDEIVLGKERLLRQSGGIVCTTGYAISQRGAAKLMLRHAVDLDEPIDMIMMRMVEKGDLIVYSVMPQPVAQWMYKPDLGMDRGNSDIQKPDHEENKEVNHQAWDEAHKSHSVWKLHPKFGDLKFQNPALDVAWKKFFSEEDLDFKPPKIPGVDRGARGTPSPPNETNQERRRDKIW